MDALPKFLHFLGQALSEKKPRGLLKEGSKLVREHAEERARDSGYGPSDIVQELQMLRETVTHHLEKELDLTDKDYETIQKTFDQAIQEGLMEFFLVHAELKEQFTATLGHDLRTPLSSSIMSAQIIQKHLEEIPNGKTREKFGYLTAKIVKDLKRVDRMIQDFLDASALQLGEKLPLKITECDLFSIAQEVIHEIAEKERSRIILTGNRILGHWDCEGLRRALENLIMNAIKYGAKNEPITINLSEQSGHVSLSVHNYGNPIDAHEKDLIFNAFSRSQSAARSDRAGWGIGLSMVRAISESLGGTATVESDRSSGTTFTVELPLDARDLKKNQLH
ncbi:sensor histidine kinase [Peredibacter sp. HCB2-198]|uniref:sensor histidine kinase n=1 Tax=Peredibacter sp. HCB2-198 TaxID=3383025 RepID=UPI0038B45C65